MESPQAPDNSSLSKEDAYNALRRHVIGFYYDGMSVDNLVHRLRTEAGALIILLRPFIK